MSADFLPALRAKEAAKSSVVDRSDSMGYGLGWPKSPLSKPTRFDTRNVDGPRPTYPRNWRLDGHQALRNSFSHHMEHGGHRAASEIHTREASKNEGSPLGMWHASMAHAHHHAAEAMEHERPSDNRILPHNHPVTLSEIRSSEHIHAANSIFDEHFGQGAS